MQFTKKQIIAILSFVGVVAATPLGPRTELATYKGTKVIRLALHDQADVSVAQSIVDSLDLETWTHKFAPGSNIDVVVPKTSLSKFYKQLDGTGLTREVLHEDLQTSIDAEASQVAPFEFPEPVSRLGVSRAPSPPSADWFKNYHPYTQHLDYLKALVAAYPKNAELVYSGQSTGNRNITGIHIWGKQKGKPAAVLHGNVHAREWITSKVTEYFATQLLANGTKYTNKLDFYIFPIVNPDGFIYTQTNDRLWRKNRLASKSSSCYGTDINRNWNFKWDVKGGASTNPCAQDYKGTAAESTAENKGLAAFIKKLKETTDVKLYIDYHSYSQLIMSPWGYTSELPPDYKEHQTLLKKWAAASKKRYGTNWDYGASGPLLYPTTGDSVDYTYGALGIKYAFTVELRDTGRYGFVLPAAQIVPSGEEAYDGFKNLLKNIKY